MDIVTYALLNGKIKDYASNVDEWLEENVDPATGYVLDRSLQMENAAAPADMVGDINDEVGDLKNTLNSKADVIYDTASGDTASFPDGADGLPVKDLTVSIEPVQSGTGDPSPTNVRPISGWTGANVARTGFNVWDEEWVNGTINPITGEETTSSEWIKSKNYIPVLPNTAYFYSHPRYPFGVRYYDSSKNIIGYEPSTLDSQVNTTPSNCAFVKITINRSTYSHDISVNYPSTDTAYHAYIGTTIPISWQSEAGTVYGGTLDVTSGVLTVDRAMKIMNGSETWGTEVTNKYYTDISITIAEASVISNIGVLVTPASLSSLTKDGEFIVQGKNDPRIIFYSSLSLDGWKTYLGSNNAQLLFKIATPLVVQLDSVTVTTLLGQNNVWSDTGSSTVEYPADTKLYIQKINTPTDDDMIADANIASGQYFIVNNNLYLSTAAILAGDPIKPGTNCTLTNLAAALNAINS